MNHLDVLLERLVTSWRSQGLEVGPRLTEGTIAEFERQHRVSIPVDLKQYFLRANGMNRSTGSWPVDMHEISFYPLAELERYTNEAAQLGAAFIFADYLISSHDYVVDLSGAPGCPGRVFAVGGPRIQVANDFCGFLDRYLAGDPDVLQPWRGIQSEGAV